MPEPTIFVKSSRKNARIHDFQKSSRKGARIGFTFLASSWIPEMFQRFQI